jgi:hypothetical protein
VEGSAALGSPTTQARRSQRLAWNTVVVTGEELLALALCDAHIRDVFTL